MRIMVVSNMFPDAKHPSYGVFVKNFCDALDKLNVEYNTCVMKKSDSRIIKLFRYFGFYCGTCIKLLFGKYDLVYVHYASHSSIPVLFANKFRKKTVYTNVHGSDVVPENKKQAKMQKYTKKILSISKKVIVPSGYFEELVSEKYNIDKKKIHISPSGGVNSKVFYKEKEKENGECLKMGFVGRISYGKGWDTLLEACATVPFPYKLTVVGDGPEYVKMKKLAEELNIHESINWVGLLPQERLRTVYNDIDVFVFPTRRAGESLGLVAIEAMACGTPVIASDYAAPKYYIIDGENGLKFECGNSAALCDCIERFYKLSGEEKQRISKNGMKTAARYSSESIIGTIAKVLADN